MNWEDTHFRWETPHKSIETLEFNRDQNIERMTYREYLDLWSIRLNKEDVEYEYKVEEKKYKNGVREVTLLKRRLMDENTVI